MDRKPIQNEKKDYLPLGTIIRTYGSTGELMIIARALMLQDGKEYVYVDYGAVLYPQGLIRDQIFYINRESIMEVIAEGYRDKRDETFTSELTQLVEKLAPVKADLGKMRERKMNDKH